MGLFSGEPAGLSLHALTRDVDKDGDDNNKAKHHVLDGRGSGQQRKAVAQHADDQRADDGAEHGALAAHERCAADDTGRDRVGIERLHGVNAVGDGRTADRYDAREGRAQAGKGIAEGKYVSRVDTGQPRGFRVAAHAVDRAAQRRARQEHMHDDVKNDNQQEADRHAAAEGLEHARVAQPHNAGREAGYHLRAGYQQREAPQEVFHAQGGYERVRQVQAREQHAVDPADQRAGGNGDHQHQYGVARTALYQHARHTSAKRCVRAYRQVDAGRDQTQQHADTQQGVERGLAQYVH